MRLPLLLVAAAGLALPAVAAAKEVGAVDVCGSDGCGRITDRAALLPDVGVVAFDDGHPGATFMPVGPALAWTGLATVVLLATGAWRARRS